MSTTGYTGMNSASQAGSWASWSGISNMKYPTNGEATVSLTTGQTQANYIYLSVPHGASTIPTGSAFEYMSLAASTKKTGLYSSGTSLLWSYGTNWATRIRQITQSTDETYQVGAASGDQSFWSLGGIPPIDIITRLKSGSLYFRIECNTTSAVICTAKIKQVTCRIDYRTVEGKRGSLIAAMV